jgi:hypothetical protein
VVNWGIGTPQLATLFSLKGIEKMTNENETQNNIETWDEDKINTSLMNAFEYFYHMDQANAKIHLGECKFSPITFQLAKDLYEADNVNVRVLLVRSHVDKYEMDMGR